VELIRVPVILDERDVAGLGFAQGPGAGNGKVRVALDDPLHEFGQLS
jgi:hypothetical protein